MQANTLEIRRRNCPELNDFLHINFLHIQVDLWRLRQGRAGLSGRRAYGKCSFVLTGHRHVDEFYVWLT